MSEERKTLEQRHQMTDLERLRHSAAHVLATAVLKFFPEAQFAAGPPVENGFYYDVQLDHRITPEDFERIEAEMKRITKENQTFEKIVVSRDEALEMAKKGRLSALSERNEPSVFKLDIIQNIPEGEEISLYKNGDFIDLCAGPHVMRTGNIGAFKLTSVASAYYKGDENNPQLQRIYGTAFKNKTALEEYFTMLEEAKKRDHRKLGKELQLFTFDDDVGPGLPLWLPNGTAIIEELEKLAKETEFAGGYDRVRTPHLARANMYITSGHLPYYAESMFPPLRLLEAHESKKLSELEDDVWALKGEIFTLVQNNVERMVEDGKPEEHSDLIRSQKEDYMNWEGALTNALHSGSLTTHVVRTSLSYRTFFAPKFQEIEDLLIVRNEILTGCLVYLKAMNCPHHHKLFGAVPRSYRDLPLRFAEYGTCYRYEQSGELFGLMRVRAMQMNDAHIYCTEEQFAAEFEAVNQMYLKYFAIFGIDRYQFRFSTHDPKELGKKFVDQPELWLKTEKMVRDVLVASGAPFVEVPNEGAFYGPKIDIQIWSIVGREFTLATNQVDFAVPARFGLTYKTRENTEATPLCIHRAPLGTHERFIGFLIEHYAGNFPLWLAPEQVRILPMVEHASSLLPTDRKLEACATLPVTTVLEYAKAIHAELRAAGVRAKLDLSNDPVKAKIASAEQMKVHTMLVLGQRDLEAQNISVRVHGKGNLGAKPRNEVIADLLTSIKERRAQ